jgi:hypothetical protein
VLEEEYELALRGRAKKAEEPLMVVDGVEQVSF